MKESAGILLYRIREEPEYLLVHPGGPFFAGKDEGWWTIPKGEPVEGEALLETALREFREETGYAPTGPFTALSAIIQKGGKRVHAWAAGGDLDAGAITCNTFETEWPPRSGKKATFPEVDRAGWFGYARALELINERQQAFIEEAQAFVKKQ